MKAAQFQSRPHPQQYGYTSYYPTTDTGVGGILETMMPMIMMIMMLAMVMPMMKGAMAP